MPVDLDRLRDVMTTDLNATIRDEVTRRGWNFVDGVFAGFSGHGFCASDHWTYHPEESLIKEGDFGGTAHPTADGHAMYGERIERALLAELYAGGDLSRPLLPGYGPFYRRGDANDDGTADMADAIRTLAWLFAGGTEVSCLAAADSNGEGSIDISDATHLLGYLFLGGEEPAAPFHECGPFERKTARGLTCESTARACR